MWFVRYRLCPVYGDFGHYLDHVQATVFNNVIFYHEKLKTNKYSLLTH